MTSPRKLRVLLLAPNFDAQVPGESWSTYKWVEGISEKCDTVVLTQHRAGWDSTRSPTKVQQLVNWVEPDLPGMKGRIAWEMQPGYVFYYFRARKWLKQALSRGEHYDIVHQMNPLALRYPCPARGLGLTYIVGPLAGSLPTPDAFKSTTPERQWYRKLRGLDALRLKYDPWLTGSYAGAAAVIGVAPYVADHLKHCNLKRFEIMAETGVEHVASKPKDPPLTGEPLRLLFVGRLIRTKGIIEAIESVAIARATCHITFDIVGAGDLEQECERTIEARRLGDIVKLHGRQSKEEVFHWYDRSHVFLFPSYREPSGNVVFEAMSCGLPVIASAVGGPGYVVTMDCGFRINPGNRSMFVSDIAHAIKSLAICSATLATKSQASLERVSSIAIWPNKISSLLSCYAEVLRESSFRNESKRAHIERRA